MVERLFNTRCEAIAVYMVLSKATVRQAAKVFGLSKSTIFVDVTERLPNVNPMLFNEVRKVLDYNKEERSIRGGNATKRKFELMKAKEKL